MEHSPARSGIDVGSVIAGTYTIEALIGRGGMGAVFQASHARLPGKKVAIKVLHAGMTGTDVLARFKREAEIASRLGHPNIVQVHDFNVMPDGTPYLVLELLEGESLAQRIARGPLKLDHALSIVRQVGSALAAAHREGIVHRDLKPQNIFLVPSQVDGRVVEIAKVLDFGISKILGSQTVQTQDTALLGTPQYMAPEQATGQHANVDERTDVFALGAIVYEMVSGHPAFTGQTIPEVVFKVVYEAPAPLGQAAPSTPDPIVNAVMCALAKRAEERFATVSAFVEALTGEAVMVGRPSIPPPEVGFAAGSRLRDPGNDAFAQTMDSGDHGASPIGTRTPPPPESIVHGSAPTVDSQNQPGLAPLGLAGTVSIDTGARADVVASVPAKTIAAGVSPRTSGLRIVALGGGAAAVAAVVMFLVMRNPPRSAAPEQPEPPGNTAIESPERAVAEAAADPLDPDLSETQVPETDVPEPHVPEPHVPEPHLSKSDVPPTAADTARPKVRRVSETAEAPKLALVRGVNFPAELVEAEAALRAEDWDRAERLVNVVRHREDIKPRHKAAADVLLGKLQCLGRNDESGAGATVRRLKAFPKLRKHVLAVCHDAGYLRTYH